jgi:hypothetical protein
VATSFRSNNKQGDEYRVMGNIPITKMHLVLADHHISPGPHETSTNHHRTYRMDLAICTTT